MCEKVRYAKRALAVQRLDEIRTKGEKRTTRPQRVYYCPVCGGYHLTSSPLKPKDVQKYKERAKTKVERLAEQWAQKNRNKWQN